MDNNQNNYKLYREMCINYMKENKDEFIPFIEDDEPYDKYISRMEEDGEWGGNLEIYALSKVLNANFYIYIHKHPMYIVNNFEKPKKNILLTYHEGKHYNSLRKLEEKSEVNLKNSFVRPPQYLLDYVTDCPDYNTCYSRCLKYLKSFEGYCFMICENKKR